MDSTSIIKELSRNKDVFKDLLTGISEEEYLWKQNPSKWCLLEVVCHLYDEEREDFRARTRHVLETPTKPLPPIDPPGWVEEREYMQQYFNEMLDKFLRERERSVEFLQAFPSPNWDNAYHHPKFGKMSAKMFLSNWLAHDYLHIRQILRLKFNYLQQNTDEPLNYAGEW